MGLSYRLWQFWQLLRAPALPPDAWSTIEAVLSAPELELFCRQARADRVHSFKVLQTLREAGETDAHLLAAALLHDAGKSKLPPGLWDRTAAVLGERLFPARVGAWGQSQNPGWHRPFVIREQHAAWGAELAREAGSHPTTVRLIRHHQEPASVIGDAQERRLLECLQWADGQN